nr:hypothetical protein [Candidatus Sigynarchaeum springense]MDO8119662.1 hypothetical protein [Candidatus Sigynarchaeota archaeon]
MMIEFPEDPTLGWLNPGWAPLRVPMLLIEVSMAFFGAHLAFKFFKNYLTLQDTSRGSKMHAAWGWLFTGYATTIIIYIIADFYAMALQIRFDLLEYGYVAMATGALFYIYNIESVGVIKTRHVFTIIFGVLYFILLALLVMSVFLHLIEGTVVQFFAISFMIPVILFFFIYSARINQLIKGKMKVYSAAMVIGLLIFMLGWMGATDFAMRNLGGLWIRLIADILQCVGLSTLGLFFSLLPSWREIEWRAALKSLFVIYRGGSCVYQHDFTGGEALADANTIMGGVVEMVKSVLDQVLLPGSMKVFDFKDKKMLMEQGKFATIAVIADSVSDSLCYMIHDFTSRFEVYFGNILQDWNGDTTVFEPTRILIKWLFN